MPKEEPQPKKTLTAEQTALRDRVRRTLAALAQQPFNTRENTVADIVQFCTVLGCQTTIRDGAAAGQKLNGITCLCWNMPCGGQEPLAVCEGHLAARVGYGYQDRPGQLAAMLALARVPAEYPARAGETTRTVADLIEYEKLSCRSGADLSLRLVALSYYASEPTWKNGLGEDWSLQRMVKQELDRTVSAASFLESPRLLGLSCALDREARDGRRIEGDFLRAKKFLDASVDYAFQAQNSDGSWGRVTSDRAAPRDYVASLSATGCVLEWLAVGLPEARLEDAHVVKAIQYVDSVLSGQRYRWNVQSLSSREIGAVMSAAHAMAVYDRRLFQPADLPPAEKAQQADRGAKPEKVTQARGRR